MWRCAVLRYLLFCGFCIPRVTENRSFSGIIKNCNLFRQYLIFFRLKDNTFLHIILQLLVGVTRDQSLALVETRDQPHFTDKFTFSCIHTFKNHSYCETSVGEIRYFLAKILLNNVHYTLYNIADGVATIYINQTGVLRSSNVTSSHEKLFRCRIVWGSNPQLPQILPTSVMLILWLFSCSAYRGDQCGCGSVGPEESNLTNSIQLQ